MTSFGVLAEPSRRHILDLLRRRDHTVGELVTQLGASQPAVSKHLRILRAAGLVEARVAAQHRVYRLRPQPLEEIDRWLAPYRALWSSQLDRLEHHLTDMEDTPVPDSSGTLERAGTQWRLRFVRHLAHPPARVWRAVTEPVHLAAWFPQRIEGDWAVGAPLRFVSEEGDPFSGQVLAVDPPTLLEFTWGDDTLRLELTPTMDGTTLTLCDTFAELGKAARDAAGWHVCLASLAASLDGTSPNGSMAERWSAVHPAYVARFGSAAATIGPPADAGVG